MLLNIFGIIVAILVLSILVAVHEAGHLLMAKWSNIRVDTFSIGMGKPIWGFQKGETYYQIGRLPFGGFCAFGDEENNQEKDEDPRSLMNSPLWARILTIIGGSLFNIIFAFLVMAILYSFGINKKVISNQIAVPNTIMVVNQEIPNPAFESGLRSEDTIIMINDQQILEFIDIPQVLAYTSGLEKKITYVRDNMTNSTTVQAIINEKTGLEMIGVQPIQLPIITEIQKHSPADLAGFQKGDTILSVNNQNISYLHQFKNLTSSSNEVAITVLRNNEELSISVSPTNQDNQWVIGIIGQFIMQDQTIKASNIIEAFTMSSEYITSTVSQIGASIVKLFSGQTDVQKSLSGPVRIVALTGDIAQTMDITLITQFMIMLSLALAVFNMLPVPGLDGGALILQTSRVIFKNNKIAEKIISWIEYGGVMLLLFLALFIFVNDIKNLATEKMSAKTVEYKE